MTMKDYDPAIMKFCEECEKRNDCKEYCVFKAYKEKRAEKDERH